MGCMMIDSSFGFFIFLVVVFCLFLWNVRALVNFRSGFFVEVYF
jgi:hypothetical protein